MYGKTRGARLDSALGVTFGIGTQSNNLITTKKKCEWKGSDGRDGPKKAASSRVGTRNAGKPLVPNAPPSPLQEPFSTFAPIYGGIKAHEVPSTFPIPSKPKVRISMPREEASVPFSTRGSSKPQKVRPTDFQKLVKKLNGMGDLYDHLANF